jgi:enoyl-CoA hydratase/carnithine racemase
VSNTGSASPDVLVDQSGRVAILTLNRPEARNALNRSLLAQLQSALDTAAGDPEVGAIVLTGAGSAFCAGADLKESASDNQDADFWSTHARTTQSMRIHQCLPRLPKPVIAAVNGPAVAGGCGLAMSCDLVIASDQARFGYPEVVRGLVAAMVMASLSRVVGRRQALDLLLTGRIVGAAEARDLGMINRVVEHERLLEETIEYAAAIASNSVSALRITKDLFRQVQELDYDRALEYARDVNLMTRQTRDAAAGTAEFGKTGRRPC